MKSTSLFLLMLSWAVLTGAQEKPAWRLYDATGHPVTYREMIGKLAKADMVFFGEEHNNPIAHWLEYEVLKDLHARRDGDLMLGAEMLETDNQLILDEYLQDLIPVKKFEAEARLWKNYRTDYKPLVDFAHDSGLVFVATNIPRRYAAIVAKKGFEGLEALSDRAKGFIHPLPIPYDPEVKCYKEMLSMKDMGSNINENFPKAQAVKDATMAWSILRYWEKGKLFLHFNGSYHSDHHQGILWYIDREQPALRILTLSVISQKDPNEWDKENNGVADYVIVVPEDMTKTY